MVENTTNDDPTTQAYVATLSKPHSYTRSLLINAVSLDDAWAIANAAVAGTAWTVIRVIVQPPYTGNVQAPDADGTATES